MSKNDKVVEIGEPGDISIKYVFHKIKSLFGYLKSKWVIILIVSIIGASLGLCYSIFRKPTYVATCTFVLDEESKKGGLGQYSGLASLAGISLGGSSDIFQGDNILELYKSRTMIEKALLSNAELNSKNEMLIERYIDFNNLRDRWKKNDDIDNITFTGDPEKFSRKQDSIINDIVELFNKKYLSVAKPDKKLSIIEVDVSSKDELFAKEFTNTLVETVNEFYIKTTTKKTSQNVQVLQRQADSVKMILNTSISGVAHALDAAPNANPLLLTLKVPSQRKQVDVQANTAIYSEIVKNLEIEKISLRQETPLIQVIDKPVLPLTNNRMGKLKGIFLGAVLGMILTTAFLLVKRVVQMLEG